MRWIGALFIGLVSGGATQLAWSHQGHHHHPAVPISRSQTEEIAQRYRAAVEPIFRAKCLQCHGGELESPWYYRVPGIRQVIDHDRDESKEHLDFSQGYPFKSHASPTEDFEAIRESVNKGTMPPFLFLLAHPSTRLTADEKKVVTDWAEFGLSHLKAQAPAK